MKARLLILIIPVLASCGVCKHRQIIEYRDSVRVEYKDRVVRDTATFEVVREVEKVVTRDTSSHLENSYAKSDAVVSDGFLSHSLESKPQVVKVPVEVTVTDTVYVERAAEIKYIEKELTDWQKYRLNAFWWLLGAVIALLAWIFRKPILNLLKICL